MSNYRIEATKAPDLTDAEARRRLARVYRIIMEAGRRANEAAVRGELGDPARTAAGDTSAVKTEGQPSVYHTDARWGNCDGKPTDD